MAFGPPFARRGAAPVVWQITPVDGGALIAKPANSIFLIAPAADFTDGVLTTSENIILSGNMITGLVNGVTYIAMLAVPGSSPFLPAAPVAPVISDFAALAESGTTLGISWTQDVDTSAYFVLTLSATPPTSSQIVAGLDESGNSAIASWSATATGVSGSASTAFADPAYNTGYHVHAAFVGPAGGATIANDGPVALGIAPISFGDSEVPISFADAKWGSQTLTGGWWVHPTVNARADTSSGDMAVPTAAVVTICVDVRVNGTPGSFQARLWENATGGANNQPSWNTSTLTFSPGSMSSGGMINMGGGVYRCYAKKSIAAGRLILDFPLATGGNANHDFKNPALFYADLSPSEIAGLV